MKRTILLAGLSELDAYSTLAVLSKFIYNKNKNKLIRSSAFNNYHQFYKKHSATLGTSLLNSLKNDSFVAKTRKYKNTLEMAMDADDIKIKIYKDIIKSVHKSINLLHDYLNLKKSTNTH